MRSVTSVCMCVSVCLVGTLTFECLELLTIYFSVSGTFSAHLGQGRTSRLAGQGQGHMSVTKYTSAGGLLSTERQSSWPINPLKARVTTGYICHTGLTYIFIF